MTNLTRAALVLTLVGGAATPASADWLLTPYLGITFGGSANFGDVGDFSDNLEKKITYGVTSTWMGGGPLGFEIDLGTTPNFFEITTGDVDFDFGDTNVTTLMANLVIGAPYGTVRPYGSGGIGLLRTNVSTGGLFDDLSTNELGLNVGGGVYGFFSDNVGLRGDVRYFRALQSDEEADIFELALEDFNFWRATIGVTFRLGG